jgi:hypothetical protein
LAVLKKGTDDVATFAGKLRAILTELPPGEVSASEQYERFYRGLNAKFKVELNKTPQPGLEAAIAFAERIEGSYVDGVSGTSTRGYIRNRSRSNYQSNSSFSRRNANGNSSDGPTPMELGAILSQQDDELLFTDEDDSVSADGSEVLAAVGTSTPSAEPPSYGRTQAEMARCALEGRCIKCLKVGHVHPSCRGQYRQSLQRGSQGRQRPGNGQSR